MIQLLRKPSGAYAILQNSVIVGEISSGNGRGKSAFNFSLTLDGVYWQRDMPSSKGGSAGKSFKSLRQALQEADAILSNPDMKSYHEVEIEMLQTKYANVIERHELEVERIRWKNHAAKLDRVGNRWDGNEDNLLTEQFKNGMPMIEIAKIHGRKVGGVVARLQHLGLIDNSDRVRQAFVEDAKKVIANEISKLQSVI